MYFNLICFINFNPKFLMIEVTLIEFSQPILLLIILCILAQPKLLSIYSILIKMLRLRFGPFPLRKELGLFL